jgi:hypothetical protein
LRAASSAAFFFSAFCSALRSIRSCVRLARSAKSSAPAERLCNWVSSLLLTVDGFTAVASEALAVVSLPPSPPKLPTEAAAIPATPITQAEGTATVSRAERFAGLRRREREAARDAARGAGMISSMSSSSGVSGTSSSLSAEESNSSPGAAGCSYGSCSKVAVAC